MNQRYLLVIQADKPSHILGLFDLGKVFSFVGDETVLTVDFASGASVTYDLRAVYLSGGNQCMAMVFEREAILTNQHKVQGFYPVSAAGPGIDWTSGSGLANNLRYVDGLLLAGLSNPTKLGPGGPPLVYGSVSLVGTPLVGNQIQVLRDAGLWQGAVDSETVAWELNTGSGWTTLPDTANTLTPTVAGFYRAKLVAVNAFGPSLPTYTPPLDVVAP